MRQLSQASEISSIAEATRHGIYVLVQGCKILEDMYAQGAQIAEIAELLEVNPSRLIFETSDTGIQLTLISARGTKVCTHSARGLFLHLGSLEGLGIWIKIIKRWQLT